METFVTGRELKETFTLDGWIAMLNDDDFLMMRWLPGEVLAFFDPNNGEEYSL